MVVDLMIKVAIIGSSSHNISTLVQHLKNHFKEEEIAYLDNIDQLVNKVKENNESIIDLSNLSIIMLDSIKPLDQRLVLINQQPIKYIKEKDLLYEELPKQKYGNDKLKKDNYKNKQKIKNYKR